MICFLGLPLQCARNRVASENRNLFSFSSGVQKSEIKLLAGLVTSRDSTSPLYASFLTSTAASPQLVSPQSQAQSSQGLHPVCHPGVRTSVISQLGPAKIQYELFLVFLIISAKTLFSNKVTLQVMEFRTWTFFFFFFCEMHHSNNYNI